MHIALHPGTAEIARGSEGPHPIPQKPFVEHEIDGRRAFSSVAARPRWWVEGRERSVSGELVADGAAASRGSERLISDDPSVLDGHCVITIGDHPCVRPGFRGGRPE